MRFRIRGSSYCFLALLLCLTASQLLAQSTQSTILGTVKDTTGAVIPNAEVVVTNVDKGVSSAYRTDASGNYQAIELIPGTYKMRVTKAGFETRVLEDLQLTARQQLRADVTLAVGRAQQEVTVNADSAGAIETETASISASLSAESVSSLPVNYYGSGGTSPVNALQALPGVQSDTASGVSSPTANGTPNTNFSVQGGQPSQTEASVDGISTQNVRTNTPLVDAFPSAESIAEIRVDGVNNNAEFGQAGEITTISKSGSNRFHGAAFWHFQNSDFDATAFGQTTKPQKNGNDFGVSVGGPVRRDKTFFFGTYEGFLFPKQSTIRDLVPTAKMLTGDFSTEFPTYPLLNPATEQCYFTTGNPLCGASWLSPFNKITNINASAQPFLPLFPSGGANYPASSPYTTIAAAEAGAGYNYTQNRASDYNSQQFDVRVDQRFSPKMLAFARFTFKDLTLLEPQDLNIASVTQFDNYRVLASSLIYNFTPNLLNEFRFGWTSEENGLHNTLNGAPYTTAAGFDAVSSSIPVNTTTGTEVYFTGDLTSLLAGNINQTTQSHLFQFNDSLTWVKGRHTVKFGGDIRALNFVSTLGDNGLNTAEVFPFYGLYTSGYQGAFLGTSLTSTAYQFADFLTGAPVETKYFSLVPRDEGATVYYAFFGQDQWRITPKLTFSFGVRYEYDPAMHSTTGTIGNFDPSVATTGEVIYPAGYSNMLDVPYLAQFDACGYGSDPASTAYAACTPVLSNTQAGLPSGLRKAQKDRILPRIGLAWRPFNDDKTAVRAGFGIYNTTLLGDSFFAMTDTLQSATLTYNNLQGPPYYPPYIWPQTSPGSSLPTPQYGTASFTSANQINWKNPYSMQWNLSIDHEFRGNMGARISYIGMKTDDLVWAANENDMPYSSTTKALSQPLTNRPFPNWQAINDRLTGAQASYNALQAEANRRFQHGLTFQSTYTWSKNLADNQGTQASGFVGENGNYASYIHNLKLDYGNVYGTRRQRWITTGVYELPLGRGRSIGANMNRAEDAVIGGWQLSSVFVWQTGPYMTAYIPGGGADPSGTGSGVLYALNQRPDRVPGQSAVPANRTRSQWLNPMAFACPSTTGYTSTSYAGNNCGVGYTSAPIGRFGTESVGDIVGPGTVNLSAGLSKRFSITDNVHLRAEGTFTNVLNHTNLNDPNLNITSPLFGKITSNRGSDFGGARTGQVSVKIEF
ncbi:MAG: carboxypeptidase regulatory-like domain-containing protein [Terracidiphilus sp.]